MRILLSFLLLFAVSGCLSTSHVVVVEDSTPIANSKATLYFYNQGNQAISFNLYTGYDRLPNGAMEKERDPYAQTLDYYERSNSLIKKQMLELRGLQKRSILYPPYRIMAEMQQLGWSFLAERAEWKATYPVPKFYERILTQVRDRSFHAGIFDPVTTHEPNIRLAIPSGRTVMLFIKEGRQKGVRELTHFLPKAGHQYHLIYRHVTGETALKQNENHVQYHYGILDLYEIDEQGAAILVSSTDPEGALLDHPERFEAKKYALLLKVFEHLLSYSQLAEEEEVYLE